METLIILIMNLRPSDLGNMSGMLPDFQNPSHIPIVDSLLYPNSLDLHLSILGLMLV